MELLIPNPCNPIDHEKLTRWRAGKSEEVQLKLTVMGTYSATAPYNCPKSQRIFDAACKALENEPLNANWCGEINALALLATGNPAYLPKLQAFARKVGPTTMKLERGKMDAWEGGIPDKVLFDPAGQAPAPLQHEGPLMKGRNESPAANTQYPMTK